MSTVAEPVQGSRPGVPSASTPAVVINERYLIPAGIVDLPSYSRWMHDEEHGWEGCRRSWLNGLIHLEMPTELVFANAHEQDAIRTTMATFPTSAAAVSTIPAAAITINERIWIPAGINDLKSYSRWAREERPERCRIAFLAGVLWIDLTMEQAYTHNQIKTEITTVLNTLARAQAKGCYFTDGMSLLHDEAGLDTIPDGMYIADAAFEEDRIREVPGRQRGVVEFNGTPDMVLEIVSESSVQKDMVRLPVEYRQAAIPEFWRVDARADLRFEIFRLTADGYVATQGPDGWWPSAVFGQSFRMTQQTNRRGQPQFNLEARP